MSLLPLLAVWIGAGVVACGRTVLRPPLLSAFSVYFLLLTRPLLVLLPVFELVDFMEFKLGFHGHVGPCRICRLGSDIFLVVYIYDVCS